MLFLRIGAIIFSAWIHALLVAPHYYSWLAWVVYLPMFWALREGEKRSNRWLLVLYGVVAESLIYLWIVGTITRFSNIPAAGAWPILGLFAVVYGLPFLASFAMVHPLRKRFGSWWIVLLPAWLVLVEYLAMRVILFPYNVGVVLYRDLSIWQLTSVTGVWGMSYLMVLVNAALGEVIYRRREGRPLPLGWLTAVAWVVVGVLGFGNYRLASVEKQLEEAEQLRVMQIQDRSTMKERMGRAREGYEFWKSETAKVPPGSADLVVWAEGASPYSLNSSWASFQLWELVDRGGFDLVVGGGTRARESDPSMGEKGEIRRFNSVYFFGRERVTSYPALPVEEDFSQRFGGDCEGSVDGIKTLAEARVYLEVAQSTGRPGACVNALTDRLEVLKATWTSDYAFAYWLVDDAETWGRYQALLAEVPGQLSEVRFEGSERRGYSQFVGSGDCETKDCKGVYVQCRGKGDCSVYPSAPHYDKMVPLPFGEYLPGAETFPWLADLIKGPGNFRAGTEAVVFEGDGVRLATPICYEAILGYVCSAFESPDLLVNVTNDAWFADREMNLHDPSQASALHGMLAASRATELGVPVVRSAYSGISFVVEPHGKIYAETPVFDVENRMVPVRKLRITTLYSRWGDWFVILCGMLIGGAFALKRVMRNRGTTDM